MLSLIPLGEHSPEQPRGGYGAAEAARRGWAPAPTPKREPVDLTALRPPHKSPEGGRSRSRRGVPRTSRVLGQLQDGPKTSEEIRVALDMLSREVHNALGHLKYRGLIEKHGVSADGLFVWKLKS